MRFTKKKYPTATTPGNLKISFARWKYYHGNKAWFDRFDNVNEKDYCNFFLSKIKDVICAADTFYVSQKMLNDSIDNSEKIWHLINSMDGVRYSLIDKTHHYVGILGKYGAMFANGILVGFSIRKDDGYWSIKAHNHLFKWLGVEDDDDKINEAHNHICGLPNVVMLFKSFASLKHKDIMPNGKIKDTHCKYKSDLDIKIGLLTENWYTESCRGHPFVVRWHWRAQRYGEGLSKTKLIKIDEYMKQGYTKGAYKEQ